MTGATDLLLALQAPKTLKFSLKNIKTSFQKHGQVQWKDTDYDQVGSAKPYFWNS